MQSGQSCAGNILSMVSFLYDSRGPEQDLEGAGLGFVLHSIFFFFNFTILYWFCHISTWICHRYTRVPHPEPSSLPVPSFWVIPVHQPQESSIMHGTWTGDSFHIWYYTCFSAILPNHPTLSLSHRAQKTVLYISVSVYMVFQVAVTPSFESLSLALWHLPFLKLKLILKA